MQKYSKQRELILETVKDHSIHPTAEQVYHLLKKEYPKLSLGTVYRNLNTLCEVGLIQRVSVAEGKDHFDGTLTPHIHMQCVKCNRIVDIVDDGLIDDCKKIAEKTGQQVLSCEILLKGVCKSCLGLDSNASFSTRAEKATGKAK